MHCEENPHLIKEGRSIIPDFERVLMLVKGLRKARGITQFLFYYVEYLMNRLDAEIKLKISVHSICLA